jgi:phosphate transport system permease protein
MRAYVIENTDQIGQTVTFDFFASSRVDGYIKGRVTREDLARDKNLSAEHLDLVDQMIEAGVVRKKFNPSFIFGADASESRPEQAGLGVSMLGSLFMMLVVLFLALPIGVAASIYLEEFAPKNRLTDLIEVNISNLAAVPSIVFGILGLAFFIQFCGGYLGIAAMKASAPLVGGLVLTLMTLPTIIISTRAASEGGSALNSGCSTWGWGVKNADCFPPCVALGSPGYFDRHDYWPCPSTW